MPAPPRASVFRCAAPCLVALCALAFTAPPAAADVAAAGLTAASTPLTDSPGNPARGRLIVRDLDRASCLICHAMPIPEEPDHGTIGPDLTGIALRYTAAELRQRLIDPRAFNPDTIMPGYFRTEGLTEVLEIHRGQTIYSAQELEDVLAYLLTLTEQTRSSP